MNAHPNAATKASIQLGHEQGWIRHRTVQNLHLAAILSNELDRGEAEAIALSIEIRADLLLLDEREARVFARQAEVVVTGVLGILLRARVTGKITSVKNEIDALRIRAGFFVARDLERAILRSAGE